jgi:hypothetical protein
LNVALFDRWHAIPVRWNHQSSRMMLRTYRPAELDDAAVVHFTGRVKPWHHACLHPATSKYRERYRQIAPESFVCWTFSQRWELTVEAARSIRTHLALRGYGAFAQITREMGERIDMVLPQRLGPLRHLVVVIAAAIGGAACIFGSIRGRHFSHPPGTSVRTP